MEHDDDLMRVQKYFKELGNILNESGKELGNSAKNMLEEAVKNANFKFKLNSEIIKKNESSLIERISLENMIVPNTISVVDEVKFENVVKNNGFYRFFEGATLDISLKRLTVIYQNLFRTILNHEKLGTVSIHEFGNYFNLFNPRTIGFGNEKAVDVKFEDIPTYHTNLESVQRLKRHIYTLERI